MVLYLRDPRFSARRRLTDKPFISKSSEKASHGVFSVTKMTKSERHTKRDYITLRPTSIILPRRDVYTYIKNGLAISVPDGSKDVQQLVKTYLIENLSKLGESADAIQEIQLKETRKNLTKFFVIFTTEEISQKFSKSHKRTMRGKRVNVQPAVIPPIKKVKNDLK